MAPLLDSIRKPAILASCLSLGLVTSASAQMTSGAGPVVRQRVGHRVRLFDRRAAQPVGSLSGVGPRPSSVDRLHGAPLEPLGGRRSRRPLTSFGPGVDVSFPNDPYLLPFMELEQGGAPLDKKAPTRITNELLKNARMIATPEERSLALQRLATGAIASRQLFLAHQLLEEAITATSEVTIPLVRDQRLMKIVETITLLTDATLLQGRQIMNESAGHRRRREAGRASQRGRRSASADSHGQARMEAWRLSGRAHRQPDLSQRDVVQGRREHGVRKRKHRQRVCKGRRRRTRLQRPAAGRCRSQAGRTSPGGRRWGSSRGGCANKDRRQRELSQDGRHHLDRVVRRRQENRPTDLEVSRDGPHRPARRRFRAVSRGVSSWPAESRTASREPRPCSCWPKRNARDDQNEGATASYQEAAKAVATVQQDGLRGVLAGFVVDSLIASGRFQDARKCIVLYPDAGTAAGCARSRRRSPGQARLRRRRPPLDRRRGPRTIPPHSLPPCHHRRAGGDRAKPQQGLHPAARRTVTFGIPRRGVPRGLAAHQAGRKNVGVTLLDDSNASVHGVDVGSQDKELAAHVSHPRGVFRAAAEDSPWLAGALRTPGRSIQSLSSISGVRTRRSPPASGSGRTARRRAGRRRGWQRSRPHDSSAPAVSI